MASKKSSVPPTITATPANTASPQGARLTVSPDALKERFGAQQIPLAADFASLIDMADVGSRAVGQASDQDGSAGAGLTLDNGKLKVNNGYGITTSGNVTAVKANVAKAIVVETEGIGVNIGNGLTTYSNQLTAKANAAKAIVVEAAGIGVDVGNGLIVTDNQLTAKPNAAKAIVVDASGIGVNIGDGLTTSNNQLTAKVDTEKAIFIGPNGGIGINPGVGLATIDSRLVAQGNFLRGIHISADGIGLHDAAWEQIMARAYNAKAIARDSLFTAFLVDANGQYAIHLIPKGNYFPFISPNYPGYVSGNLVTNYWGFSTYSPQNATIVQFLSSPGTVNIDDTLTISVLTLPTEVIVGRSTQFQAI